MSTTPRFGGQPNKENTERAIKRGYLAPVYAATIALLAAGYDSINAYHLVNPGVLTGAVTFTIPVGTSTTGPMVGDVVEFLLTPDGTSRVATFGTGFAPNGTLSVTTAKYATISFVFNGTAWVEKGRTVTA